MGVLLSHIDLGPALYGLIMWAGLFIMLYKLLNRRFLSFAVDIAVFYIVFKLHGGTQAGGFAAMICALFAGLTFPFMLRRRFS